MFCTVSETYDLSTQVNKMGLLAIHTPDLKLFAKHWGGAMMNHKKFRFVKCDLTMACASMLPADPLQIGVEAGDLAPQDMFNPILYKAVSNDSYNNLLNYLQLKYTSYGTTLPSGSIRENSVLADNSPDFKDATVAIDQFDMYYGLLSNTSGWKKAMPQAGLQMRGLYPIVYSMVSNVGNVSGIYPNRTDSGIITSDVDSISADENEAVIQSSTNAGITAVGVFRGPSMRMPSMPTKILYDDRGSTPAALTTTGSVVVRYSEPTYPNGGDVNDNVLPLGIPYIPPCYVGVIVLPPAKLNKLYYRLKVSWTIELIEPESLADVTNWSGLASIGDMSYGTDYVAQSKATPVKTAMVDGDGASIQKVMEGV